MRRSSLLAALALLPLFAAGCGLRTMLPADAVLSIEARQALLAPAAAATVTYTDAGPGVPVLPFPVFGLAYDLDLVVVARDDRDMHEFARIDLPDGETVWIVKEALLDGRQFVLTNYPDPLSFAPELRFPVRHGPIAVTDRSAGGRLDLEFHYEDVDGRPARMRYRGGAPEPNTRKRNGSTMQHSHDLATVVLDLAAQRFGRSLDFEVADRSLRPRRILGLVPYLVALEQVQGGLIRDAFDWRFDSPAEAVTQGAPFQLRADGRTDWVAEPTASGLRLSTAGALTTLVYHFERREAPGGAAWEFRRAEVWQLGREAPVFGLQVEPALPDLSRAWTGVAESRFVMDVGTQASHGTGRIRVTGDGDAVELQVLGEAPWWVRERPFRSRIRSVPGGFRVEAERFEFPSPP